MNTLPNKHIRAPKRILHCITDLSPDGAQRTLLRLAQQLESAGFQNRVVALKGGGGLGPKFMQSGLRTDELASPSTVRSVHGLYALYRIIREWKPEIIQGWMYHGNVAAYLAAILSRSRATVLWNIRRCLYEEKTDKFGTAMMIKVGARLSRHVTRIIYCAELAAEQHEGVGFSPHKRIVIPNGFDIEKFHPTDSYRHILRAELGLPESAILVGAVGRYHIQKDWPNLFRAAAQVRRYFPEVHFVAIGRGVTQENQEIVRELYELGMRARFHLLGERHDMPQLLSALDLFVSSSLNEGFSNVIGEALACGVPCVSTEAGVSRALLSQIGEEGREFVVPRMNSAALARAMVRVLALSKQDRQRLIQRGRSLIVNHYSLESMVNRYAELYGDPITPQTRTQQEAGWVRQKTPELAA